MSWISLIITYIWMGLLHGIAYTALIGLSPALWYLTAMIKLGDFSYRPYECLCWFATIWFVGFLLVTVTGPWAGIFIIFYGIAYFLALHLQFWLTVIVTVVVGFIYEIFNGRISLT